MSDAEAFGVDGFRLAAALSFSRDVFHRGNHATSVGWIECGNDSHGKTSAIPMPAGGLGGYRRTVPDPIHDAGRLPWTLRARGGRLDSRPTPRQCSRRPAPPAG